METGIFFTVLGSALLHALWNTLVKKSTDKNIAVILIMTAAVPLAAILALTLPNPAPASWPYIIVAALLHLGYQTYLAKAYALDDFSVVYPLARGSAPFLIAAASILIFDRQMEILEITSILILSLGIGLLAFLEPGSGRKIHTKTLITTLITGSFIASYSLVGGIGARASDSTFAFFSWVLLINVPCLILLNWRHIRHLMDTLKSHQGIRFFIAGNLSFIGYTATLWAFTQAPIALVAALRETSILFALFIAHFFLSERLRKTQITACIMIAAGAAVSRFS